MYKLGKTQVFKWKFLRFLFSYEIALFSIFSHIAHTANNSTLKSFLCVICCVYVRCVGAALYSYLFVCMCVFSLICLYVWVAKCWFLKRWNRAVGLSTQYNHIYVYKSFHSCDMPALYHIRAQAILLFVTNEIMR